MSAAWIIGDPLALGLDPRVGPEGGDGGGEIVAAGTPEDIVKVKRSYTGQFLKPVLSRSRRSQERGGEEAEAAE